MLTIDAYPPQGQAPDKGRDRLDMAYINSLPLPLWDGDFPVYDIDVETGLYRIDVCGLLEVRHIDRCFSLKDATGKTHYVGDFELDPEFWEERARPDEATQAAEYQREQIASAQSEAAFKANQEAYSLRK